MDLRVKFSVANSISNLQQFVSVCKSIAIRYHSIPYTIPHHTIPYHTIPYHTIPYHTIPYHTIFKIRVTSHLQHSRLAFGSSLYIQYNTAAHIVNSTLTFFLAKFTTNCQCRLCLMFTSSRAGCIKK